ncbi:hypothetical protein MKX01_004146 [Papaver californicum]|nr:hypothetical protein MKX01_004146 [Papaver californicum]
MVIEVVLNVIETFHRFVGQDMMTYLMYPLQGNIVPFWGVSLVAILFPMEIIAGIYFYRRDVYDLNHAILGLLFVVLIPGVLTDAFKDDVGRPQPDFFWRCFPDGKRKGIKEGNKSFPSGHTSWSFAGLGFLAWYLEGKIRVFDYKSHVAKLCLLFLPLIAASLVEVSQVDDYWHHWKYVYVGGLLGMTIAFICYFQFFPPPYDTNDSQPAGVQPSSSMNNYNDMQLNNVEYGLFNDHETERPQHPTVAQNIVGLFHISSSLPN